MAYFEVKINFFSQRLTDAINSELKNVMVVAILEREIETLLKILDGIYSALIKDQGLDKTVFFQILRYIILFSFKNLFKNYLVFFTLRFVLICAKFVNRLSNLEFIVMYDFTYSYFSSVVKIFRTF